jgi:hypothetical protein
MKRKIVGVTVGTPISPQTIKDKLKPVTSVNGVSADRNGNVEVSVPVTPEQIANAVEKYLDENPVVGGVQFETDATLKLENGVLSVNTTDQMEQDNTLPMTSAGVYATVGNIEALLKTI